MANEPEAMTNSELAGQWWELLHSDEASNADHREFGEWVGRSPERVAAYLKVARLSQALKSSELIWPTESRESLIQAARSTPEAAILPLRSRTDSRMPTRRLGWYVGLPLGAAAAVMVTALFFLFGAKPQQFATDIGEQRSVVLTDGTRVTLNTASRIEVDLRPRHRRATLLKGEALFEVTHDDRVPFEVHAGNVVLQDVGTQFNVDLRADRVSVDVIEGKVAVGSGGTASLLLSANDRLLISDGKVGVPQHGVNMASVLAWTQRRLMFERRPLSEIAEEFNRYNRSPIEINGEELRAREVTGVFNANDPASFLAFLSSIPGVAIKTLPDGTRVVQLHSGRK